MITLSTKDLRNNFPSVVKQLETGQNFLLIHRSRPIAEIRKPQGITAFEPASEQEIESSGLQDVSEDFLSPEEIEYYRSLV